MDKSESGRFPNSGLLHVLHLVTIFGLLALVFSLVWQRNIEVHRLKGELDRLTIEIGVLERRIRQASEDR